MIPFDGAFAAPGAAGVHRPRAGRAARRGAGERGGELPLRPPRPRRRRAAARPGRVRDARGGARDRRRRRDLLQPHPQPDRGGGDRARQRVPRLGRSSSAGPSRTATSAGARSATRRPTSCPTRRSSTPATASTPAARPWRWTGSGAGGPPRPTSASGPRSSRAAGCSWRRSCSTSRATCTAASCGWPSSRASAASCKFDSIDALIDQMARDVDDTRRIAA